MSSIQRCDLPETSLLSAYRASGAYTDCYLAELDKRVSQIEYIQAFYTTLPFKMERKILQWAVAKPSTDDEARLLAEAKIDSFAAWEVEERRDDQILLSDYRGRTRSWLMSEPSTVEGHAATRLYFGSAVVPVRRKETDRPRMGTTFSLLLQFHKLYSRVLLSAARSKLAR